MEWHRLIRIYFPLIMIWSYGLQLSQDGDFQRWNQWFPTTPTPDRPLASVPYALSAERANIPNGAISLDMLDSGLRSSLQPEQTTTISDDFNLTNQDTIFAALI